MYNFLTCVIFRYIYEKPDFLINRNHKINAMYCLIILLSLNNIKWWYNNNYVLCIRKIDVDKVAHVKVFVIVVDSIIVPTLY